MSSGSAAADYPVTLVETSDQAVVCGLAANFTWCNVVKPTFTTSCYASPTVQLNPHGAATTGCSAGYFGRPTVLNIGQTVTTEPFYCGGITDDGGDPAIRCVTDTSGYGIIVGADRIQLIARHAG
ncbi:hypothetical protein [Nocardia sp. NPDC020380]|uniref:hypothetical protein n=1 Tax=Nocardia sp. NPDC020380 TaxID=3364309 RepID=UPI0037A19D07